MKKFLPFILILVSFSQFCFAQSSSESEEPVPYDEKEIPYWVEQARRTEIITLGSLPFVTIGVSLGYSIYNCAQHNWDGSYFANPFTKGANATQQDQINILVASSLVAVGIGVTNLTINLIKHHKEKKDSQQILQENVKITTIENELNIVPVPEKYNREKEYLYGSVESAVF